MPWGLAEEIYHEDLCEDSGAPIVPARVALGALLIKERMGLTDFRLTYDHSVPTKARPDNFRPAHPPTDSDSVVQADSISKP